MIIINGYGTESYSGHLIGCCYVLSLFIPTVIIVHVY